MYFEKSSKTDDGDNQAKNGTKTAETQNTNTVTERTRANTPDNLPESDFNVETVVISPGACGGEIIYAPDGQTGEAYNDAVTEKCVR